MLNYIFYGKFIQMTTRWRMCGKICIYIFAWNFTIFSWESHLEMIRDETTD